MTNTPEGVLYNDQEALYDEKTLFSGQAHYMLDPVRQLSEPSSTRTVFDTTSNTTG